MKSFFLSLLVVFVISCIGFTKVSAQVGIGTTTPNSNAVLELKSPGNNQGFLVPRLTTAERTAMSGLGATEKGLLVFDTNDNKFYYWSGTAWIVIEDSVGTGTVTNIATGAGLAGGPISVTGTISLADNGVTTVKINNDAVTSAKILDGTVVSGDISDGTIATADLADGSVNSAKITDATIATGDIANSAVTDAKIGTGITVSKLSASATAGQVLTTVGTTTTWATLPDASATNEIQDLSLTTNTLSLSGDATTVNLAPYLDNTDAQALTFTSPNLSISGGNSVNLAAINTDAQALTFTSPNLSISGGNSVNLSTINTDSQDLSLASNTLSLTGDATTVSLAAYLDNTDNQDLSLAGSTLSLTNDGTTVSLSSFLDNTDAQALTFTSPNLSISGGNSVNLSAINTDAQTLTFTSPNLSISGGNSISLSAINTDNQDLSLASNTLSLSGDATTVSLAAYLDNTDNQDLTLASNTLSLSGDATTVSLASYLDNTDAQTLTFTPATSALAISGGNSVTVTATGTAGGDLNGSYPNPTVDGLQGRAVASTLPSNGQVLEWNGSAWAPGTDDSGSGGVSGSGTSGQVAYWSGGTSITGNSNLLWDEKDNLLGIGITPKTNLHLGGSHAAVFTVAKDGAHPVDAKDYIIICAPGTTDILLPDAAEIPGRILYIRATDPKSVTVRAANGKDTIDGLSQLQIADRGDGTLYAIMVISIGTDKWMTLTRSIK